MKPDYLLDMPRHGISFDTETYAMVPGVKIPPIVCASAAYLDDDGAIQGEILDKEQAMYLFAQLLDDPKKIITGANVTFDLSVMALRAAKLGVDVMPKIFDALEDQRVFDLQLAEALHAIAEGHLGIDPTTGGQIKNADGKVGRYSLYACVKMVLGREDAKANDEWRLRYGELDQIPMSEWPQTALDYPVDDARNTIECALAQAGHRPRLSVHRFAEDFEGGVQVSRCLQCRKLEAQAAGTPCWVRARNRNLHDLGNQVGTQFALHMAGAWGLNINQDSVNKIEAEALRGKEGADIPFIESGVLRKDKKTGKVTQDLAATKKMVAVAYGANDPCEVCQGTGKVPSPKAKTIRCRECRGASAATKMTPAVLAWKVGHPHGCDACHSQGTYVDPTALVICYGGMEEDPEEEGKLRKIKTCDGTGLALIPNVPRSDKEGVGYGRDVLNDSGDEHLIALAAFQEDAKDLNVYVPFFRRARMPVAGHSPECPHPKKAKDLCTCHALGCPSQREENKEQCTCYQRGFYKSIPLTLWPNTIVETGRVSYDGIIQLLRRATGYMNDLDQYVPSLRECCEARPGFVYSSTDYESGELVTLAEVCNKLVGWSDLGDALNAGMKPHNMLGASMIGMLYEEYTERAKEPMCKDARQAAKAGNFGYPGGCGAATLVLQKRKEAIDTPCPNGPHWIEDPEDETGPKIRGYKGLRFCILMDKAEACGVEKITEYRDRMIPPTCKRCIECALRLKEFWTGQWSEMKPYFDYVSECIDQGMLITEEMLEWWPHLKPWFTAGERLAPGEIMQLVSGRVRGGVTFTQGSNSFFQGLLADACKAALRRCSRECYDATVIVPEKLYDNSVPSAYAGKRSPLYGSRAIVFAHDEIIFEHPEAIAHDAVMRVSEVMVDCLRMYCPTVAKACKAEPTLMRKWFKNATKVVHNGRVVPWTPEHNEKTCVECHAEKTRNERNKAAA